MENSAQNQAEEDGFFGIYGGAYVPETLTPVLKDLERGFKHYKDDHEFQKELSTLLRNWAGRPTPLYYAENLSKKFGAEIYFKREDLLHGGAHKTNNALGQVLLAKRMGKTRIIAETGAGQHGVATAMACSKLNMPCDVYMGAHDVKRQAPNVDRMRLLGTNVIPVMSGSQTLKDAVNEALRDWTATCEVTHYVLGSVAGPHPFPTMVRHFHSVIGQEVRQQCLEQIGRLPDFALACVGGGSNAIGLFSGFMDDKDVKFIGAEPGGKGVETDQHGAVLTKGTLAVMHGMRSLALQDEDGQIKEPFSISAGLDYPLIGPQLAQMKDTKRAKYVAVTDEQALYAFHLLAEEEGIIPALETAHAIYQAVQLAQEKPGSVILVNLSGRGDKDLTHVIEHERAKASKNARSETNHEM